MRTNGKPSAGIGKGGLLLGVAKLWFLAAAYVLAIGLTHFLPPADYGSYYVVARLIAVPNMVIIYSLLFTVSRPLAAEFDRGFPSYFALRGRGIRLALILGGASSAALLVSAVPLAELLHEPELAGPIAVVAPISVVYALYAVNLGTLNAVRRFNLQASLDIFMATAKTALILAAAAVGASLTVVVGGFTAASALALAVSALLLARVRPAGAGRERPAGSEWQMLRFAGALLAFTGCVNLLQSIDVLILKRFAAPDAVGFYSSAQQVALVPFSLMNAVSLLMFPLIAAIDPALDAERVRRYVSETAKVTLLLLALMAAVASSSASDVQALLFPRAYGAAADELRLLVWGCSGYSFAVTSAWIFNSTQRSRMALWLVTVPLATVVGLCLGLVPHWGTTGAAWAVFIAGVLATIAALLALAWSFQARPPWMHMAKVAGATALVGLVAHLWPETSTAGWSGKALIVLKLAVLTGCFVAVVFVTRAVTRRELRELRHG